MCCSLEKGIEELRELEIAIHSTTQMSSQLDPTLIIDVSRRSKSHKYLDVRKRVLENIFIFLKLNYN